MADQIRSADTLDVAAIVGEARRRSGLSLTVAAERCGLTSRYLSMLEQGQRGNPALTSLTALTRGLPLTFVIRDGLVHVTIRREEADAD
jgi:transcriptional regulator with XRE-family HTH domain